MAATLPSEPLLLLAWIVGGVIALCGGLTYAEMGAMYPRSGGLYVFLEEAYGSLVAFLFGWACMLVILTGGVATVAVGFATYFSYFVPSLSTTHQVIARADAVGPLVDLGRADCRRRFNSRARCRQLRRHQERQPAAGDADGGEDLCARGAADCRADAPSGDPVFHAGGAADPQPGGRLRRGHDRGDVGVRGGTTCRSAPGKSRTPRRTVPIALVVGIVALVLIYLSVNLSYMLALPLGEIQGVERIAEKAVNALVGAGGARIVAATVVVSTLGCNAAVVIAMSRACYAMASDGMFFKSAAAVHPRYRTPHVAIAMTCAWSALLTLTGTYEQLFTWVTFASVTFGVLGGLAIFQLRRLKPDAVRPYRTWGYPFVPALFVAGARRAGRQYRRREAGRVADRSRPGGTRPSGVRVLADG